MKLTHENILKILSKYDVEGLIRMGAPINEYASEAKKIYQSLKDLNNIPNVKYIQELVDFVLWNAFEVFIPDSDAQVEDLIVRDFNEWQKEMNHKTEKIALEIRVLYV